MARVINKVFLHVIDYEGAPELAVLDDGTAQINGEETTDPKAIVEALFANAKAWGECVDRANVIPGPEGAEAVAVGETEATFVQTYTGLAVRGPWPLEG